MNKLYYYNGAYGILDETLCRIYWVEEDLSPIWSSYIYRQKSMYFYGTEPGAEFICELDFDYIHVTDLSLNASLD